MLLELLVGFNAALNLLTGVVVAYALWRYSFKPFEAVKKSMGEVAAALAVETRKREELETWIRTEMGLRKALVMDDATVVRAEQRLAARQAWNLGAA